MSILGQAKHSKGLGHRNGCVCQLMAGFHPNPEITDHTILIRQAPGRGFVIGDPKTSKGLKTYDALERAMEIYERRLDSTDARTRSCTKI